MLRKIVSYLRYFRPLNILIGLLSLWTRYARESGDKSKSDILPPGPKKPKPCNCASKSIPKPKKGMGDEYDPEKNPFAKLHLGWKFSIPNPPVNPPPEPSPPPEPPKPPEEPEEPEEQEEPELDRFDLL
jgi:hypothetical protein